MKYLLIAIAILLAFMMFTYIDFSGAAEQPGVAHGLSGQSPERPAEALASVGAKAGTLPATETNPPPIGGPFTLTDDTGQTVTEKALLGRYTLMFFGFTHCADACPTMLSTLAQVSDKLPPVQRARLHVVFISIDPDRDTPQSLGAYVHSFNPAFSGWTGTKLQLDGMVKAYLAYYGISRDAQGNEQVSHSDLLYLMGPDGKYIAHFRHADSAADIAAKLAATIR